MAAASYLAVPAASFAGEVLDRVTASVGNVAITASDVQKEYRLERFLDGQWPAPAPDAGAIADVRERLTRQILLSPEETSEGGDQAESEKAAAERLAALRKSFAHPEDFQAALHGLGMTESQVLAHIAQQERLLRVIDQRLRPVAAPSQQEVSDYYQQVLVPDFQKKNPGAAAPPLSEVENQIRKVLTEKRINELLDQWIEELKPTSRVRFHSFEEGR